MTPYLKLINATRHGWSALIYFIYFITKCIYQALLNLPLSHRILLSILYLTIVVSLVFKFLYGISLAKSYFNNFGQLPGDTPTISFTSQTIMIGFTILIFSSIVVLDLA